MPMIKGPRADYAADVFWTLVGPLGVRRPGTTTFGMFPTERPATRLGRLHMWWRWRVARIKAVPKFLRADRDMYRLRRG